MPVGMNKISRRGGILDVMPAVAYGGDDENTYVHDVSDGSLVQTLTESGGTVNGVALL